MSLRAAFLSSIALALAGAAMILLGTGPMIEAAGLAPFDTRSFGYSLEDARAFLTALTPEGRAAYLGPERIADTLFPIGLLGTLALGVLYALRPVAPRLALVMTVPALAYFVLDMMENAAVAALLTAPLETLSADAVARASALTVWKFRFVWLAIALLIGAFGARILSRSRR